MKYFDQITKIVVLIAIALLLSNCYREKPIHSELGKPRYRVDSSISAIDELQKSSGVQVVYEFDPATVTWNLGNPSSKGKYLPIDKNDPKAMTALHENLHYILEQFINLYPKEFQKKYMPLRIFLCDSIMGVRAKNVEEFAWYGIDHMAINLYSEGDVYFNDKMRKVPCKDIATYYKEALPKLHATLFQQLSVYKAEWPRAFVAYCEKDYDTNLIKREEMPDFDPRKYGFWTYDEDNVAMAYYHAIKFEKDISDFVERFVSYSEAENLKAMEGFPELRAKYDILRSFIRESYGIDLQEIGNKSSQNKD